MQRIGRLAGSRLLIVASCFLLVATAYLYITYGSTVYFVAFHKPLHFMTLGGKPTYVPPVLPHFSVTSSITGASLIPGDTQVITVTATPDRSVQGYVQVWIKSPGNTSGTSKCAISCYDLDVYQDKTSGKPTQFVKGKSATFTYSYKLPSNLPAGTYQVSDIITSQDTFTDYYVHNNFAEFTVQ